VEITISQCADVMSAIEGIRGQTMSGSKALKAARLKAACLAELKTLQEAAMEVVKKYGIEQEGGNWQIPKERLDEYRKEDAEMGQLVIEVPDFSLTVEEIEEWDITPETATGLLILIGETPPQTDEETPS